MRDKETARRVLEEVWGAQSRLVPKQVLSTLLLQYERGEPIGVNVEVPKGGSGFDYSTAIQVATEALIMIGLLIDVYERLSKHLGRPPTAKEKEDATAHLPELDNLAAPVRDKRVEVEKRLA